MDEWAKMLITVVCSVVASGGFWSYLQARREKKDAKTKLLLGLAHDRIMSLAARLPMHEHPLNKEEV